MIRFVRRWSVAVSALWLIASGGSLLARDADQTAPRWREAEQGILQNHVPLTSEAMFYKAGECYFSPDGRQIIFQAIEVTEDPGDEEKFYQMYVADLVRESGRVTGIDGIQRLSPPGSSNTCGWFHPTEPGVVIFGSTVIPPSRPEKAGYQRGSSRYVWQFPQEMNIVRCELAKADGTAETLTPILENPNAYLAECVISGDGGSMVFCEHLVDEGTSGGDLFILDFESGERVPATRSAGYDGGPFFSPEGKRICYRSDRRGDDLLQIFIAELAHDKGGKILGVQREFQLTDNVHVNWAPYWHPDGRHLVYTTSEMGHENYEVFLIDADAGGEDRPTRYGTRRRRVTHADRFDGLPVFNADGSLMMWTCQRGPKGSSQVWLANFVMPLDETDESTAPPAEEKDARPERLQVKDPDSGLIYLYDRETHQLEVYNPKTHKVREVASQEEMARAMTLFRQQTDG